MDNADLVRSRTMANNLVWLDSFGCHIQRSHGFVEVVHPQLPEFRAYLLADADPRSFAALKASLVNDVSASISALYVDDKIDQSTLRPFIGRTRPQPTVTNVYAWAVSHDSTDRSDIEAIETGPGALDAWVSMYASGFGRNARQAKIDRSRWALSWRDPKIRHWTLLNSGVPCGVFQTCHAQHVVGLYSFTLLPSARRKALLRPVLDTIIAKLAQEGERLLYFERVERVFDPTSRKPKINVRVVRRYLQYEVAVATDS